jgi:hypothetical protein
MSAMDWKRAIYEECRCEIKTGVDDKQFLWRDGRRASGVLYTCQDGMEAVISGSEMNFTGRGEFCATHCLICRELPTLS